MVTREQRRAQAVPALASFMRSHDVRSSMVPGEDGVAGRTLIIGLPDDTMDYVFDRLRDAGGSGTLALLPGDDSGWTLVRLGPSEGHGLSLEPDDEDDVTPVHPDSDVFMFCNYMRKVGSAVIQRVHVAATLIDDGELISA